MRNRWLLVAQCAVFSLAVSCGGSKNNSGDDTTIDAGSGLPKPQCSDGIDNDGDGKIDFPDDPGCTSPNGNSELDDCPNGSDCPEGANGKDDDGNGLIDYPADPGCTSASDPTESSPNAAACGPMTIEVLTTGSADGTLDPTTSRSTVSSPCGGGLNAGAIGYQLTLAMPQVVVATTAAGDPTVDTVIDIRGSDCQGSASEEACNDNTDPNDTSTLTSTVSVALDAGTYYIIVEGSDPSITGTFHLDVTLLAGAGSPCTTDADCGTGLLCNAGSGSGSGSDKACSKPECSDGIDNNGDGKIDYPNDPSCTSPTDNTEVTVCPGPLCPQCSDGIDNDGDGEIDYPNDTSCKSAAGTSEACTSTDPVLEPTGSDTQGTIVGAADDFEPSCASEPGGLDQVYQLDVPALLSLTVQANPDANFDFEPDVMILDSTCGSNELACAQDTSATIGPVAAGTYYVEVDDDFPDFDTPGTFDLQISGVIKGNELCTSPLVAAGALTCEAGFSCKTSGTTKKCLPAQCNDGIDNNGDGKIDYPFDPGCSSPSDDTETTVCPGSNCPVCSNGSDDDADGKTDFPADFGCSSAGGSSEVFCATETDPVVVITAKTTTSTFKDFTEDESMDCGDNDDVDRAFSLQLPVPVETLVIDTTGSLNTDITLELFDTQCDAGGIACAYDDDLATATTLTVNDVSAGNYALVAQTNDSAVKPSFKLNVKGTLASGVACTSALFTAGVLACGTGLTCTAGKCQ